ncbi:uncharacterized protein MELLADRAFT_108126 [Melampsora larici-populina 98AG31]|uniref:Uncharacterized protein n=1 Tax=Melampsora larici-populina (strain 98AG31 / pathotype 3-4-7) TaxID=747676 RepID=F4RS20_MELLP|nr:uncharacterized protein MELLADRAFT_108126 [Melampsora larici-populina 98AG31]EGG04779.1 hypothetical protein MELLADRAFT_108126 [Melampsora larici-populina 98AG31]
MNSRSTSPSPPQASFSPLQDETSHESICATRPADDARPMHNQHVLRLESCWPVALRPMPIRHRGKEDTITRPIRQRTASISQLIRMFDTLTDGEDMVAPFYSFGHDTDSDSPPSSRVAHFSIPHHMIDWSRDVTLDALTLPKWGDSQVTRSINPSQTLDPLINQGVEENCRGPRRRKRSSEQRQLEFIPRPRISPHTPGDATDVIEPRKRRKRCNEI